MEESEVDRRARVLRQARRACRPVRSGCLCYYGPTALRSLRQERMINDGVAIVSNNVNLSI